MTTAGRILVTLFVLCALYVIGGALAPSPAVGALPFIAPFTLYPLWAKAYGRRKQGDA